MLPIAGDEQIASVLAVDDFREDEYLVLLTQVRLPRAVTIAAAFTHDNKEPTNFY